MRERIGEKEKREGSNSILKRGRGKEKERERGEERRGEERKE